MTDALTNIFGQAENLWWLLLLPALWMVYLYSQKKMASRYSSLGNETALKKRVRWRRDAKTELVWFTTGLLLCIIALANPRAGTRKEKIKAQAAEIMVALDISASMDATDVSPSRLDKARRFLSELIQSRKGDQLGLIFFAGEAFLQMPFTRDYAAADMMVRSAATSVAGSQGTAIGDAIRMAMKRTREPGSRVIILVTDGEDHDSDAVEAAESAAGEGWMIVTVGVGTEAGGTVPDSDEAGAPPKMSEDGTPVISRLNVSLLQELAAKGKGKYFPLEDEKALIAAVGEQIEKAGKREMEVRSFTEYETYYNWFLACGLICLLVPTGRRILADLTQQIDGHES